MKGVNKKWDSVLFDNKWYKVSEVPDPTIDAYFVEPIEETAL